MYCFSVSWNLQQIHSQPYNRANPYEYDYRANYAVSIKSNNYDNSPNNLQSKSHSENSSNSAGHSARSTGVNNAPYNNRYNEASTRISGTVHDNNKPRGSLNKAVASETNSRSQITYQYGDSISQSDRTARFGTSNTASDRAEVEKPLKLHGVAVPVYKFRGEDAQLECLYDQGTDPLYSVKWYKDDHEFFR